MSAITWPRALSHHNVEYKLLFYGNDHWMAPPNSTNFGQTASHTPDRVSALSTTKWPYIQHATTHHISTSISASLGQRPHTHTTHAHIACHWFLHQHTRIHNHLPRGLLHLRTYTYTHHRLPNLHTIIRDLGRPLPNLQLHTHRPRTTVPVQQKASPSAKQPYPHNWTYLRHKSPSAYTYTYTTMHPTLTFTSPFG